MSTYDEEMYGNMKGLLGFSLGITLSITVTLIGGCEPKMKPIRKCEIEGGIPVVSVECRGVSHLPEAP